MGAMTLNTRGAPGSASVVVGGPKGLDTGFVGVVGTLGNKGIKARLGM
jgi:hypothetical protein